MAQWTVLPFLGTPVTYEAEDVQVLGNGDLAVILERGGANKVKAATWPKDQWAQARRGAPPFDFKEPAAFANTHKR